MKKMLKSGISVILAVLLALPGMTFGIGAVDGESTMENFSFEMPKTVESPYFDGVIDEGEWANALRIPLKESEMKYVYEAVPAIGENSYALAMWDDNNLYLAFEIYDATPDYEDGPELLLFSSTSEDDKGPSITFHLDDDGRLTAHELRKDYSGINETNFKGAQVRTAEKYVAEAAIAWSVFEDMYAKRVLTKSYSPTTEKYMLFDIMIRDSVSRYGRLSTVEDVSQCGKNASIVSLVNTPAGSVRDISKGPYVVPIVDKAPEIDGFIDSEEWKNSGVFSLNENALVFDADHAGSIGEGSRGYIMYDDSGLYIAAEVVMHIADGALYVTAERFQNG